MKSLMRWGSKLGIVGAAIAGSLFINTLELLALPKEQVIEKLRNVPVFAITDSQGSPLVVSEKDGKTIAGIFISQTDAKKFVENLKSNNPQLAKKVKVVGLSLAEVYNLSVENAKKKDGLLFEFVPVKTQVELAKKVSSSNNQTNKYKGGVPLFVANLGKDKQGKDRGHLALSHNNEKVIPFFFEKSELQKIVERVKKENPEFASTIKIEVVPLENMIHQLDKSDDKTLNKIYLVPSKESMQFLQQQTKQKQ